MRELDGRIGIVTGAGNGIGRGVALRLAADGAAVGILDCDGEAGRRVAREILNAGGRAIPLTTDVSDAAAVEHAIQELTANFGPPTVAVHSAGIMPTGTILETSESDWDRAHAVNVKGAFLVCREAIPHMQKAGIGSIILMASITGVNGLPGLAACSSTKGALIALLERWLSTMPAKGFVPTLFLLERSILPCCMNSLRTRGIRILLERASIRSSREDVLGQSKRS
jgi:NAD(P)-dependent dehydrogenase (short-subunit alcohol dehydrogenase family)